MRNQERSKAHYPAALLVCLIVVVLNVGSDSSARRQDEPASEGRRISPAGSLLMDATTRQPAVGALPVDFVRSPDHAGRDGGGRYLVAVNSGFGLQFNAAGN